VLSNTAVYFSHTHQSIVDIYHSRLTACFGACRVQVNIFLTVYNLLQEHTSALGQ